MKKILTSLSNWAFRKWGTLDERVLIRKWLKLNHQKIDLEKMGNTEKQELLGNAKQLWENKFFQRLVSHLTETSKDATINDAETREQILAARINIHIIEMFHETAEAYYFEWLEFTKEEQKEEYDSHSTF